MSDVLRELSRRGITTKAWIIRTAISSGKIERPDLDGAHRFIFEPKHVDSIAEYLETPQRLGRRRATVCQP